MELKACRKMAFDMAFPVRSKHFWSGVVWTSVTDLAERLAVIHSRISSAAKRSGRDPASVTLVAATKQQPIETLRELYDLGLRDFGENRVQEMLAKRDVLPEDIRWHMIGHLQANKSRQIAPFIACVHSIDSLETAAELSKRAAQAGRTIGVLVEVNISGEDSKHGVSAERAEALVESVHDSCSSLEVGGLMGMASFEDDPERVRPQFLSLAKLRTQIAERHPALKHFTELSMGMTNDFEIAIECGATMVRIGSALFGERTY